MAEFRNKVAEADQNVVKNHMTELTSVFTEAASAFSDSDNRRNLIGPNRRTLKIKKVPVRQRRQELIDVNKIQRGSVISQKLKIR